MGEPPTGTVTFLFTDMEGSTRLLQELGDRYDDIESAHAAILRRAIDGGGGTEIRTEGDSFLAVFPRPAGAVRAAVDGQRALADHGWPHGRPLRVRMGMHTGEGRTGGSGSDADYVGIDVNRAARIAAIAHGGQVLLSESTRVLVERSLPPGVAIRGLGEHRLKDLRRPERLYDLVIEGLPADFPPLRTLEVPTNLPPERTSFVGREREIEDVTRLLSETRLLTLTGPGGTGKTRLALRVAARMVATFPDGVFLTDLSSVLDPGLAPSAIGAALGMREEPGRDVLDTLGDQLRARTLLLVLDNLEQVLDAAPAIARLLDAAPNLTVLATSRIPLRLSGERQYHVSPLALPERDGDPEALWRCDSVMLFAERGAAVRPGFELNEENVDAVADITARLDGLPLAIELAASRLKVLDPPSMRDRLERRLPLLTGGARDLPERQRTLRAAIEWSHELLDPEEQRLFARLSAFAGGWTLDSAEAVCGPGLDLDLLDGLGALVDGSLVRRRDGADGVRFRMLETIREFAAERLAASGEEADIQRRHALHIRDLAEGAVPHLDGRDSGQWLLRLELEHDNLGAALDWAEREGDVETAVRIATAMWGVWRRRGRLAESRARLERLVALPALQERDRLRVLALGALGSIAYWQHEYERMAPVYEEALDITRELEDGRLLAEALFNASFIPLVRGQIGTGEDLAREALAEAQSVGDVVLEGRIRDSLAYQHMVRGDFAGALAAIREAVALHRREGQNMSLAESLNALAAVEYATGDPDSADRHVREAFRIHLDDRNPVGVAFALHLMAVVEIREERYARAVTLAASSSRWQEELGGGPPGFVRRHYIDPDAAAREHLTDEEYERAFARGRGMTFDEAVAFALEESE
jgi:predicted ATPase/class 3 adenylate cyclase